MKNIKLGNMLITKRAIIVIIFGLFLSGMVIGAHYAADNLSSPIYIAFIIPIWLMLKSEISKGIITKPTK